MSENEHGPEMGDMGAVAGEVVEGIVVTDEAIEDFLHGETPTFRPILRIWHEVLKNARAEKESRVGPAYASRIVQTYPGMRFDLVEEMKDRYFDRVVELLEILEFEIATDADCLTYDSPEDDSKYNGDHYKNLLLNWQKAILSWEMAWESNDPSAAADLASISEVHKMFFSETGLTSFLDNIKFQFDEADQQLLADALEEMKASR